jgi:hypothetical protein
MTISQVHSRYAVQIDVLSPSVPVNLAGVTNVTIPDEWDVRATKTGGDVYPRHIAAYSHTPRPTFRTVCLQDALDQIGLTGLALTYGGINLYAQKFAEGAMAASGSVHRKYNITEGLAYPVRLTCDHRQDAEIEYGIIPTYDGSNDPIVETDSSALPTAPTDNERFTLGSVTIESIAVAQLTRLEVDFGAMAQGQSTDSDIYETHCMIREIRPTIRLTGTNIEWLKATAIPRTGLVFTHANTKLYLRKRGTGASAFVANGTAEHIKITAAGLAVITNPFDDQGDDPAQVQMELTVAYDGTNAPLVITTASAIT